MNDLAYIVAIKAFRASQELADLYRIIVLTDKDELIQIKNDIAPLIGKIDDLVIQPALKLDPDNETEIQRRLDEFGIYL